MQLLLHLCSAVGLLLASTSAFQAVPQRYLTNAAANPWRILPLHEPHGNAVQRRSSSTTRLYVFERMSEGCIAAVVAAQEQAAKLQLPEAGPEVMMAGCIAEPETKALRRTLQTYGLNWRTAQRTLASMYNNDDNGGDGGAGWLSGFRAAKQDDDRPFSKELKQTFNRAGRLADQMSSAQITADHVFLALLEYQETKEGKTAAIIENDICMAGGWAVLVKMNTFDVEKVAAVDMCQTLLNHMLDNVGSATNERELVTGIGASGETPTLAECGIDLTQQARDGLLDPVFGREKEIRACLRTLIRRRKNNVCLTGEPGVGKVSKQAGVAPPFLIHSCLFLRAFSSCLGFLLDCHCRRCGAGTGGRRKMPRAPQRSSRGQSRIVHSGSRYEIPG